MALYAHARFDDLDLDARSQWFGKGNKSGTPKQAISIKLAVLTVGLFSLFYVTLTLQSCFVVVGGVVVFWGRLCRESR